MYTELAGRRCENILAEQAYSPWGILSCFCFRLSVFRKTIEGMLPSIICFHRCLSTTYAQVLKHTRRSENVHAASPMIWSRDNSGTLARIAIGLIMIYLGCTSVFAPLSQDLHDRSLWHMYTMHVCVLLKFVCLKRCMLRQRIWLTHDCLRQKRLLQMPVHTKLIVYQSRVLQRPLHRTTICGKKGICAAWISTSLRCHNLQFILIPVSK